MKTIMKNKKSIALLLLIMILALFSCGPSAEEKAKEYNATHRSGGTTKVAKMIRSVNSEGNIDLSDTGSFWYDTQYEIYTLDECEYVRFSDGNTAWGGHSGTCPNPIHQYKPEQIYTKLDTTLLNMKPQIILNMRISVDSTQKQRYTEEQVITELENNNVVIERKLIIRKTDGAVMGEILNKN